MNYSKLILFISFIFLSCSKENTFINVSLSYPDYSHSKYHIKFSSSLDDSVRVTYWSEDTNILFSNYSYGLTHNIVLPFLKSGTNYSFKIISKNSSSQLYTFRTRELPDSFPSFILEKDSTFSFDGYLFFKTQTDPGIHFMLDEKGDVIWY